MNSQTTTVDTSESRTETPVTIAYQSAWEHLSDELVTLDALLHLQVLKLRKQQGHTKIDQFAGLYISEEEIDTVFQKKPTGQGNPNSSTTESEIQEQLKRIESLQAEVLARVEESLKAGTPLHLYQLSYLFHLTPFELDAILVCLAPELHVKYETLYAYLHNDVTKKYPTVNLILDLLCNTDEERHNGRRYFCSQAPLLKYALLRFVDDSEQKPLLSRSLKLDDRIVNFLLGFNIPDARLDSFVNMLTPTRDWSTVILNDGLKERLSRLSQEHFQKGDEKKLIFSFYGPYGAGKKLVAEAFCHDLQLPVIIANTNQLLQTENDIKKRIQLLFREALLQPAAIYLEHFDQLLTEDPKHSSYQHLIVKAIEELSLVTFLAGEKVWSPPASLKKQTFVNIEFPISAYPLRKRLWELSLDSQYPLSPKVDIAILANKFRFTGGQIQDAIAEVGNLAMMRCNNGNGKITMDDLYRSCRAQSNQKLSALARKVDPRYTWDDIVLPPDRMNQLREICNQVKYRHVVYGEWGFDRKLSLGKGLNVLFSGPPGTGKTMAAEIIAHELQLDLYKIDLSQVVSKYIGETEKNLNKIFNEAQTSNAILFFDEADALFGKRSEVKDAHDRYANIEIGYLLQKMEEYDGIVILATNLRSNMDEAFVRRLQFNVEFPFPDEEYRERIWQIIFPSEAPKSEDIDFDFLAQNFNITGGNIKNIVLSAAFFAAENSGVIQMKHLIRATKRELQKMGKLCIKSNFGKYYNWIAHV